MQRIILSRSTNKKKKYQVTFEDGTDIGFGGAGYSDYTIHKDPKRMRSYVLRHGGVISPSIMKEANEHKIHEKMLEVNRSKSETWGISGIKSPGFWSRWLLWSHPNMSAALNFIRSRFDVVIEDQLNKKRR